MGNEKSKGGKGGKGYNGERSLGGRGNGSGIFDKGEGSKKKRKEGSGIQHVQGSKNECFPRYLFRTHTIYLLQTPYTVNKEL